jgi:phospholipase C
VEQDAHLSDTWALGSEGLSAYDLSVYGPNGFFRRFAGSLHGNSVAALAVEVRYDCAGDGIHLLIHSAGKTTSELTITDAYTKQKLTRSVHGRGEFVSQWELGKSFGWYDLTIEVDTDPHFRWQVAGHLETGKDSVTDPAIGAAAN